MSIIDNKKSIFLEGTYDELDPFTTPLSENGFSEMEPAYTNMSSKSRLPDWMDPSSRTIKDGTNKKIHHNRSNDHSDPSNNGDYENDGKFRKRVGKGHQSKNLEAERKRRKKLNDRLYSLRALVPNITKLDRGAILGDAINYVKELQRQVKDLQIELEEDSDDDDQNAMIIVRNYTDQNSMQNGGPKSENGSFLSDFDDEPFGKGGINATKQNNKVGNADETAQQMDPQVEVFQIDGNELFVKVFCEHKHGGFVRLLEALSSLGFQVDNVNATRHTCLVSNIFRVEKRDSETFQVDHVKESLIELARNPLRARP